MGIGYKHKKWTDEELEEITQRWFNGETYGQIAKDYGVSEWTVGRKIRENLKRD